MINLNKIHSEAIHRIHDTCTSLRPLWPLYHHSLTGSQSYKPFFIIGSGRSGNTLLRRLLNNHSAIVIPPETYVLGQVIKRFRQQKAMKWNHLVDYIFSTFEFHSEFETFELTLRPLVNELKNIPPRDRNLAFLLNRFYFYYAEQKGIECTLWGDKTPQNTFFIDRIYSVFPDANFIHIIRDGCDVVFSYVKAGISQSYEEAAERWKASIMTANRFKKKHPESMLSIHYENLVTNPVRTTQNICRFIGVKFEPEMLTTIKIGQTKLGDVEMRAHHANVLNPINTDSIGKGRALLPSDVKTQVHQIIGEQLKDLGYDKCTT